MPIYKHLSSYISHFMGYNRKETEVFDWLKQVGTVPSCFKAGECMNGLMVLRAYMIDGVL